MPRVQAIANGYYPDPARGGSLYRRRGDEFDLLDVKHYSGRWMKPLDFKPPEGAAEPDSTLAREAGIGGLSPAQLKTARKQAGGSAPAAGVIP